ncbi:MAG: PAS domain-containing protein [Spirochaetia bacterium]|nr:PAS domain-containing protein [Spirochaetia bacterium]
MKKSRGRTAVSVILVAMVTLTHLAAGMPNAPNFDYLGYEQGMSSSSVSSIVQDQYGFMWFGTQNGLNRFDGYSFDIFQNEPFQQDSLPHNLIQTMYLDADDSLWIGTYGGLVHFDLLSQRFTSYTADASVPGSLSSNVVVAISRDSDGQLWVGTLDGLNRLDEQSGTFQVYRYDDTDTGSISDVVIRDICLDSSGRLWFGTYNGLARYDRDTDSFIRYQADSEDPRTLASDYVMDIEEGDDGTLWLGLWGSGITRFDPETGEAKNYHLEENRMYKLLFDQQTLWAASFGGGLIDFTPETGAYRIYKSDDEGANPLSNDTVYSLYKDKTGIIWVGTNGGGLNRIIPGWEHFELWKHTSESDASIAQGKINSIYQDSTGAVWISIYNQGVDRYDPVTGRFEHFVHDESDPGSLSNDIVNFITEDADGRVHIGTNAGLNTYLPQTGTFARSMDGQSPSGNSDVLGTIITAMDIDQEGMIWYGTYTYGVFRYDPLTDSYTHYGADPDDQESLSDNLVRNILCTRDGTVWIGTNNGLNRYLRQSDSFRTYYHDMDDPNSLSSHNIYALYEDTRDLLWIGTSGGGVNTYDPEQDRFSHMTREDGLSDNNVLGIIDDGNGSVWISTRFGITVYAPETRTFRRLDKSQGFPAMEMSLGSAALTDGRLLFGSAEGVVAIDPDFSDLQEVPSEVVFTDIRVMGQPVSLETPPYLIDQITLTHDDSFFEFEFSDLQYLSPFSTSYAYRLEGFDEEWKYSDARNYGSYTSLPPGEYVLKVQALRSDGSWSPHETTLQVTVLPPPWKSTGAYVLYTLLLIGAAGTISGLAFARARRQKADMASQMEYNVRLEQEIGERTREIEEEKERLAVTLRSITDGVIATDTSGMILLINRAAEILLGVSSAEAVGRTLEQVLYAHDRGDLVMPDPVRTIIASGSSQEYSDRLVLTLADGKDHVISEHAAPLRDSGGEVIGVVLILSDMTGEIAYQDRLQRQDKLESLGILAGGLAHDFNNLLVGLFGYIELARVSSDDQQVISQLDAALGSYERARSLTHQLLTFSKGGEPVRATVLLSEHLTDWVSFALAGANVSSTIGIEPDVWPCAIDVQQIGQVVDNLVLNAKQAMPDGGNITIHLENRQVEEHQFPNLSQGSYVALTVSDSGVGMTPSVLRNIFDPFYTTKVSGSGLGLSTCYSIVTRHHGTIEVHSIPEQGSTFTVYLPRAVNAAEPAARTRHSGEIFTGSGTILVLDDEQVIGKLLSEALGRMGFDTLVITDGADAEDACRRALGRGDTLCCAILDLTIPGGVGGAQTIGIIRDIFPELPVFVSSGYSNDPVMSDPRYYGFTGSIGKPYRIEELRALLQDHVIATV